MRCFITDQLCTWFNGCIGPYIGISFNTTFHETIAMTPSEVAYARKPPVITMFLLGETRLEAVQRELVHWDEDLGKLKYHL